MKKQYFPQFLGTVTIGERGQVVIPAKARKIMNLKKGDSLVALMPPHGTLVLVRSDKLEKFFYQVNRSITRIRKNIKK